VVFSEDDVGISKGDFAFSKDGERGSKDDIGIRRFCERTYSSLG